MISTPVILSLETATLGGSVFVSRGNAALAARTGDPHVSHSNSLLSDINNCLQEAAVSLSEVELFACASGPGSFTGLRIGIATLKAFAATLQRPCVGVPTLNAIAHSAGFSKATVAVLPAGRGEAFAQSFSVNAEGDVIELDQALHLSPAKLIERYSGLSQAIWAGVGAHLHRVLLKDYAEQNGLGFVEDARDPAAAERGWSLAPQTANLAQHVSSLALKRFHLGQLEEPGSLSAIYVRPSDAEINQSCQ